MEDTIITNRNPVDYDPLKPIEMEPEACPLCNKVFRVFAMIISIACFGAGVGACLGLSQMGFGVVPGLIVGAAVGAVVGLALALIFKEPSPALKYRLKTLDQIKAITTNEKVLQSIDKVKRVFSEESIRFKQAYDNHGLHQEVGVITDRMKERTDLIVVWQVFLEHLHGSSVYYPDGQEIKLDFSIELKRLRGKEPELEVNQLNLLDENSSSDLDQICDLEAECFGVEYAPTAESIKDKILNSQGGCYLARDKNTRAILGLLYYYTNQEEEIVVSALGRKAGATKMGIGEKLFTKFLSEMPDNKEIRLHVRKSNDPAIALYQRIGFEQTQEIKNYYNYPKENAYRMYLNRDSAAYQAFMHIEESSERRAS